MLAIHNDDANPSKRRVKPPPSTTPGEAKASPSIGAKYRRCSIERMRRSARGLPALAVIATLGLVLAFTVSKQFIVLVVVCAVVLVQYLWQNSGDRHREPHLPDESVLSRMIRERRANRR
jgi:hypothetical protein